MARVVYSKRFIAAHAGTTETYTVPDGYVAVLKWITHFNSHIVLSASSQAFLSPSACTIWQQEIGPQASAQTEIRVVLEAGEEVQVIPGATCDVTISGYLLST